MNNTELTPEELTNLTEEVWTIFRREIDLDIQEGRFERVSVVVEWNQNWESPEDDGTDFFLEWVDPSEIEEIVIELGHHPDEETLDRIVSTILDDGREYVMNWSNLIHHNYDDIFSEVVEELKGRVESEFEYNLKYQFQSKIIQ